MKLKHPEICLFQPEIPQNAGNIGRLAAATSSRLHLVRPFGFKTSDKNLRRPGLDYWPFLDLEIHDDFEDLITQCGSKMVFFSKFGEKNYDQIPIDTNLLVFGRETSGLPDELHQRFPEKFYRIPMFHEGVRSLNLSNAVAITVYDLMRRRQLF